jgi:hypothetical protein
VQPDRDDDDGERRERRLDRRVSLAAGLATLGALVVAIIALVVQLQPAPAGTTAGTGQEVPASVHASVAAGATAPSKPRLARETVQDALLTPADLAAVDDSLKASDIQAPSASEPSSASCAGGTTHPADSPARLFEDGSVLAIVEQINQFSSGNAARDAFSTDSRTMMCGFGSATDITAQIAGLCNQSHAAETLDSRTGYLPAALYAGVVRCGRFIVFLMLETPTDPAFDQAGKFAILAEIAIQKAEALPGG